MKEVGERIHGFNACKAHIEQRLDKIDRTIDSFPRIVALVNNYYDNKLKDLGDTQTDIDDAALHKRASSSVFRLVKSNTLIGYTDDQLYLEHCSELIK